MSPKQPSSPKQDKLQVKGKGRSKGFDKSNKFYKLHRGFAFKVGLEEAKRRYKIKRQIKPSDLSPGKLGQNLVWISPDGKRILTDAEAQVNNRRRRSALNTSDAWNDLKSIDPAKAKELGWNGFQRTLKGTGGSRIETLQRINSRLGLDFESTQAMTIAADGTQGENAWGDS